MTTPAWNLSSKAARFGTATVGDAVVGGMGLLTVDRLLAVAGLGQAKMASLAQSITGGILTVAAALGGNVTATIPGAGTFAMRELANTFSAAQTFSAGTASTTPTTGAVIVSGSGGLGVGGAIWSGASLNATLTSAAVTNILTLRNLSANAAAVTQFLFGNDASASAGFFALGSSTYASLGGANSLNVGTAQAAPLTLCTNSAVRMTIAGAGGVSFATGNVVSVLATTASTSISTGALVVSGGAAFNGNVYQLGGSFIHQGASGAAAPTFTTRSAGTKIVLYDALAGASADYAIGVQGNNLWFSAPTASASIGFIWYGGTTALAQLTSSVFSISASTVSSSTTTGALVISGGMGIAGAAYIGGLINGAGAITAGGLITGKALTGNPGLTVVSDAGGGAGMDMDATAATGGGRWRFGDGVGSSNGTFVLYDYTNSRQAYSYSNAAGWIFKTAATAALSIDTSQNITFAGALNLADGKNIVAGSTTGNQIGTSSAQKLGFWGATPIAQKVGYGTPTGNVQTASFPGATATLLQTAQELAQLLLDLKAAGIIGA